jgi:diguanylate cyclase (GGDEF)-like protein
MKDLKGFLVWGAVFGSIIMFTILFFAVSFLYRNNVISEAKKTSRNIADMTSNTIYHVMKRGWTRDEVKEVIESQKDLFKRTPYSIEIFRGKDVEEFYGRIKQPPIDRKALDVFNSGAEEVIEYDKGIRYLYPLKARSECLGCHSNSRVGDVLGIIDIKSNLSSIITETNKRIFFVMLLLLPIPIFGSYIVSTYLSNRVKRPAESLHKKISDVNKLKDFSRIELEKLNLTFDEFNKLRDAMAGIVSRLREIAVDKDILEFEIKMLEKFIITTEVVKDWKEHVKHLLIEVNRLMDVYCLFSLFVVNKEAYELEIFWRNVPHEETKRLFERMIKQKVMAQPFFKSINSLNINHNIALPFAPLPVLKEEQVELQTKSLILESPGIGGIIGIGVNVELGEDPVRSLVIEGVLSTLLNVIGSVKAIYKYTKDLEYYATRDPLTDLFNQRVFWEILGKEAERARRHRSKFAVMLIDIDNFKVINNIYGHIFGDRFLNEIANIIKNTFRVDDIVCRYESDEFGVIVLESDAEHAFSVANRLRQSINDFSLKAPDGTSVKASVSTGIVIFPDHAETPKELFIVVESMMEKAKATGKDKILIPTLEDIEGIFKGLGEKNIIITNAIEHKQIIPYFQPIMNTKTKRIEGYETLMRIQLEDRVMTAAEFIESASDIGLVSKMEYLLMEKVFEKIKETGYEGLIFLNISPKALIFSEYIPTVRGMMKKYEIDHSSIVFEITERDTVKNLNLIEKFVNELKSEGFKFAVDDFGSGFSSFQYIKHFPIDFVKLEGEFIRGLLLTEGIVDKVITESITTFCRGVNIKTIAEFVENEGTLEAVEKMGIDYVQGYYIGRPAPDIT